MGRSLVNARLTAREIDAIRDHCAPRRAVYLAHVSAEPRRTRRATARAAPSPSRTMGEVLLGPCDDDCPPEPVERRSGRAGRCADLHDRHHRRSEGRDADAPQPAVHRQGVEHAAPSRSRLTASTACCRSRTSTGSRRSASARFSPAHACSSRRAFRRKRIAARAQRSGGITVAQGVPTMYAKLARVSSRHPARRLRRAAAALSSTPAARRSTPALKADVERTARAARCTTATASPKRRRRSRRRASHAPRRDCSVGTALPGVELRIVDAAGRDVATGEPGELWVRGPNVMRGYYRNPNSRPRRRSTPTAGCDTGDLARRDRDGALFIVGRTKELIIRSGFNVYPAEVEAVLNAHPAVAALGRGRPHRSGQRGSRRLRRAGARQDGERRAEIARFAAERLAPYKRPAEIVILSALPASATGKILKQQLRVLAQARARRAGTRAITENSTRRRHP